jgi:hypothetical protein
MKGLAIILLLVLPVAILGLLVSMSAWESVESSFRLHQDHEARTQPHKSAMRTAQQRKPTDSEP